jgi:hypothetical protein
MPIRIFAVALLVMAAVPALASDASLDRRALAATPQAQKDASHGPQACSCATHRR